ncbi:gamma carbonic anhydrase family protein, partial [Paraburkholderia sp. SIMBA_050]
DPGFPLVIGEGVTVGHCAVLHGCTVGTYSVIGIGAILLNGVRVGDSCLVTAGALLSAGPAYASGSMIAGSPARVLINLSDSDIRNLKDTAVEYQELAALYRRESVLTEGA